jgi:hypothetical protein
MLRFSLLTTLLIHVHARWLPRGDGVCSVTGDCSLNGDCVAGVCACDSAWSGSPSCDVISILPANKSEGYHNSSGISSWGGMSIADESGAWHLFAAEMLNKCGLGSWKTNSRIVRGEGTSPAGPFTIVEAVSVPFSHNPKILRAPDGTYLLFSIGTGLWTTTATQCSEADGREPEGREPDREMAESSDGYPGPTGDGCGPGSLNGGCGLSLGTASSLSGPWSFSPINVTNQNASKLLDCAHTNPSAVVNADGSIVMAINAGFCHAHLETIGLLQAPSWRGPWTYLSIDPILLNADGSIHHCEDPFLWRTSRGWHLMVHNQQGAGIALYAHSEDAINWVLHDDPGNPGPYTGNVIWNDGTKSSYDVERPQFIFDAAGDPLYLTNGAMAGGAPSFTLFRPVARG